MRLKLYRGKWHAVWTEDGQTRRVSLRTEDRGTAEQRLADLSRTPKGDTVAEIYLAYVNDLAERGKPPERALHAWKALGSTFGPLRPDQVTRPLCRGYIARRRQDGRKDGTIGKELAFLRSALHWHDRASPAQIEAPTRPPPRDRYLTREEYARLRRTAKDAPHIYAFVVLGLATAGRKQALLDLTWDRVDLDKGMIRLGTGKEGKGRATVPMTRHARRVLRVFRRAATSPYVIEYAGRKVGSIKRGFASACEKAGLEGVTPHTLRHTAAVWMAEYGVPMPEIAQYLGHSDDRITQRVYSRFSPEYLRKAAGALQ